MMDNFIDKLAQKFTAGEVIRANQAAEEQELKRLRLQVTEYEKCLQEMRKLQLRQTETAESLKQLVEENKQTAEVSRQTVEKLTRESMEKISSIKEEGATGELEAKLTGLLETMETNQKAIGEWFKQADEYLHKENVKVYRNVQAVVVEESKTKSEAILAGQEATAKKYYRKILWIAVITLLAAVSSVVIQIMDLNGMF
ncbi:MAG: hypothetical protein IJP31_06205 [Lachnospiraceae bacterium]|nr:hypothetical protein [Lachnospiraceae bacterium]